MQSKLSARHQQLKNITHIQYEVVVHPFEERTRNVPKPPNIRSSDLLGALKPSKMKLLQRHVDPATRTTPMRQCSRIQGPKRLALTSPSKLATLVVGIPNTRRKEKKEITKRTRYIHVYVIALKLGWHVLTGSTTTVVDLKLTAVHARPHDGGASTAADSLTRTEIGPRRDHSKTHLLS